jgi:putative transposase
MARMARVVLPGLPHHVVQRGVRSMVVFRTDEDRAEYLRLLREQGGRFGLSFQAYCLMANHVHLVVVPHQLESLARGIGEAHRRYTRGVNGREGVTGYLFQGRFWSCPLEESYLVAAWRYVERNPVRAGLVDRAWEYHWSSAAFHVGVRPTDPLVDGADPTGWTAHWREQLHRDPEEMAALRRHVRTGRPLGSQGFLAQAERVTRRRLRPLPLGRPRKEEK